MLNEKQIFTAEKLCLSGAYLLRHHDAKKVCNGIGPEWFPPWLRLLINTLCPSLILAALIHDMRYHLGGSCLDRRAADAEFMANALIIAEAKALMAIPHKSSIAEAKYKYFMPAKWLIEWIALKMFRLLRLAGNTAWRADS